MSIELPITERVNPLSVDIDVSTPQELVSILHICDEEIFTGWNGYPGLDDSEIQQTIASITDIVRHILTLGSRGAIVVSGCGTSGRLAFITTRTFNSKLQSLGQHQSYHYIMAGGDVALFTSQEAIEDDPPQGMAALRKICEDKSDVLFIGVTCGLSAPFVAGQLQLCMDEPLKYTPVLLGFNPIKLARNTPIEKWHRTFLQVAQELNQHNKGYVLNPIVGPEQVTGSSRMKSGTTTKMLLELIFMRAHLLLYHDVQIGYCDMFRCYRLVCDSVYKYSPDIGTLVEMAGNSLKTGGHIYYISEDSLGIMGMIDASECPPTYGATLDDVRGFVSTGFNYLNNNDGDISHLGRHFRISVSDFRSDVIPHLTASDLVIQLTEGSAILKEELRCKTVHLIIGGDTFKINPGESVQGKSVCIHLPWQALTSVLGELAVDECKQVFREMAAKWVLNAISTGAHILLGKIYQNIMVDLKVSNNKLFYRAVGIIQKFSGISAQDAKTRLLQSIYNTDMLSPDILNLPISEYIKQATPQQKVVPAALMTAISNGPLAQATAILESQPIIRSAISTSINSRAQV